MHLVYTDNMQNRVKIEQIRARYLLGEITLDEAKTLVAPILADINTKGVVIAKQFGKKFYKMTFGYVFR